MTSQFLAKRFPSRSLTGSFLPRAGLNFLNLAVLLLLVGALPLRAESPHPQLLKRSVERLVSFGTRHTASSATDPKRGIGASREWVAREFAALGLTVDRPARRFTGPRVPAGALVENVLGIQTGSVPNEVVIVAAHIDSRVSDVTNATSDAPGANDDGSGVALVLEAARLLSREKFRATIVYAVLSGEEQGLWGGTLLADTAKERGWQVSAMLNNDIVGNSVGTDGRVVADRVRVFSEGLPMVQDLAGLRAVRQIGGEDDSPSRALAKYISGVAATRPVYGLLPSPNGVAQNDFNLTPFLVRRPDRFGRGGDHLPMLQAGFPAVRLTVGVENYDAQHQDLRTENGRVYGDTVDRMDFAYLAKVTWLNVATLRRLAAAPLAPAKVTLDGAVSSDTKVSWTPVAGATGYTVFWRNADQQDWEHVEQLTADRTDTILRGVVVDDTFIGVAARIGDNLSLVTFGGLK